MKKIALILAFSLVAIPRGFAQDIQAVSSITKVTIYQDRALVTRQAEVELQEGVNSVVFEGLPSALIEDSLGVDGKGVSAVTINGVELRKIFSSVQADPRIGQIMAETEKLRDELKELESRSSALQQQKSFIDSVKNFSSVQLPKDAITKSPLPSEWSELSKFVLDSYTDTGSKILANDKAIREKNKEIMAKQSELEAMGAGSNIEKKTAVVTLEAKDKSRFKLEIHYIVPQATWTISYDAKVYPDKNSCALVSNGNVRQWTGEDWADALLTLSSAMPTVGGKMPELMPWFLDFYQAYPLMADREVAQSAMMIAREEAENEAPKARRGARLAKAQYISEDKKADVAQASVSQELGSVTFEIGKPVSVKSDNQFHKFPVKTETFSTALDYEATPKISPYAYIHSKITNDKDYPLVAGPMNVFVNDNYIGVSSISTVGRNETFDLYLGIDQEIKIKRTELVDKRKKTMLGFKARKDYAYKFELENYKKTKVELTVIDQIPVSKNSDIKAELVSSSAQPTETKDLGLLKWKFSLEPKEKKEFQYQFFAEYPADKNVTNI